MTFYSLVLCCVYGCWYSISIYVQASEPTSVEDVLKSIQAEGWNQANARLIVESALSDGELDNEEKALFSTWSQGQSVVMSGGKDVPPPVLGTPAEFAISLITKPVDYNLLVRGEALYY